MELDIEGLEADPPQNLPPADDTSNSANRSDAPAQVSTDDRRAGLQALIAKKRQVVRSEQERKRAFDDATTETWSGLRIEDRCVRKEKWDAGMRGKSVIPFYELSSLQPKQHNQVVIGVLCSQPSAPRQGAGSEKVAEWRLTNLDKTEASVITLLLLDRALEHWATVGGAGKSAATVGSIFGVLNPENSPGRPACVRVSYETQVLKLGNCPSLGFCSAKRTDGLPCRAPYNSDGGGELCFRHASMSHGQRQLGSPKRQRKALSVAKSRQRPPAAPLHVGGQSMARARSEESPNSELVTTTTPSSASSELGQALVRASNALTAPEDMSIAALKEHLETIEGAFAMKSSLGLESLAVLRNQSLYDRAGMLASRADSVGVAAKRLRRCWRAFLEEHKSSQ